MNSEYENNNQSAQRQKYQPDDLSLKGYYTIGIISVTIGFVVILILNLATPLEIITERLTYISRFTGPLFLLNLVPPALFLLMAYFCFRTVLGFILRPISRYLNIIKTGGSLPPGLEEKASRRLLNIPFIFIPVNMGLWLVLSAAPFLMGYLSGQIDLRTAVIISARASMVGLISSLVASHRMEAYSRKSLIPFFFPRGRLADVAGTFHISISRRIRLLNRMGSVVP